MSSHDRFTKEEADGGVLQDGADVQHERRGDTHGILSYGALPACGWGGGMITPYYQDDAVTIYHGDCREILPEIGKVDLVLTDPPYGISHQSHGQIFVRAESIQNDHSVDMLEWVMEYFPTEPLIMFFSPYAPVGNWRNVLVWSKGEHVGIGGDRETCWKRDFELIGIRNNKPLSPPRESAILKYSALLPPPSGHFAEKPVKLISYLIQKVGGELILDPFMGSGTTLRAAKDLVRKAIGIEIEERYCEISARRMSQEVLAI